MVSYSYLYMYFFYIYAYNGGIYVYTFFSLSDVDECGFQSVSVCDENAECSNAVGGFDCTCDAGYSGDGLTTCS